MPTPWPLSPVGPTRTQRGVGALSAVLMLLLLALIAMGGLGRALWTEQRNVTAQVRGVQAQEAAQLGLDRAWALLHEPLAVARDCREASEAGASPLQRAVRTVTAATPSLASMAAPEVVLLACTRAGQDWACECPQDSLPGGTAVVPSLAAPTGNAGQGEGVWVQATPLEGLDGAMSTPGLRLAALACSDGGAVCARAAALGDTPAVGAVAHLTVNLWPRPALAVVPAAALVAGGDVRLQGAPSAPVRVANHDPQSHGLAVHAGGRVHVSDAQVLGLPGAPRAWTVAEADTRLAEGALPRRLAPWLGLDPSRWGAWPRVARLACGHAGCDGRQVEALLNAGHRAVHVEGDLDWTAPHGPSEGFVLVVDGTLRLSGHGQLDAVVLAHAIRMQANDPAAPLVVRGAAIAAGDAELVGSVQLLRSTAVLDDAGRWPVALGRAAGSWRERPLP